MTGDEVREVLESFDLGRWRLAWDRHLRLAPPPDPTEAADAVLAHEVELARAVVDASETCPDEAEANAAASHLPAPLVVYAEPGGVA